MRIEVIFLGTVISRKTENEAKKNKSSKRLANIKNGKESISIS